jgi:expansin
MRSLTLLVVLSACAGDPDGAPGTCESEPAPVSGEGTYYNANGTGNCSFDASPQDLMVAAINAADYQSSALCGACLAVTGPSGSVTVRVVDQCPGCKHGDLDLSPQAFQKLSPLAAGRIPITWNQVACDVTGPIAYHFKDGANAYWTAIQIRNHRYPIAKLEAMQGSAYVEVPRLDYNYFVQASGLGPGPYMLRVTDTRGHTVEDANIPLGDSVTRTGSQQLESCP